MVKLVVTAFRFSQRHMLDINVSHYLLQIRSSHCHSGSAYFLLCFIGCCRGIWFLFWFIVPKIAKKVAKTIWTKLFYIKIMYKKYKINKTFLVLSGLLKKLNCKWNIKKNHFEANVRENISKQKASGNLLYVSICYRLTENRIL